MQNLGDPAVQDAHLSFIFFGQTTATGSSASPSAATPCPEATFETSEEEEEEEEAAVLEFATSSDGDACLDLVEASSKEIQQESEAGPSCKRSYAPRGKRHSIQLLGKAVCRQAAQLLSGVGPQRLQRIRHGRSDTRRAKHPRGPSGESLEATMRQSCATFLWQCYQQVGEAMPDRFSFAECSDGGISIIVPSERVEGGLQWTEPDAGDVDGEEAESRAVAATTTACSAGALPDIQAAFGPGTSTGPTRYLPPCKKIHLWWEYRALQEKLQKPVASLSTFLRVFREVHDSGVLRIRKMQGMHPVCQVCAGYKQELRNARAAPLAREQTLRLYTEHLVSQWLDRQVLDHMRDLSETCMSCLSEGRALPATSSVLTMVVDGMDQAKFRLPRQKVRSHAFDRLLRPALHVQGIWAHGGGYHMAVSDADAKKDTVANCEVIARMLDEIFSRYDSLPLGLHVQQDNTARECKNQKMLKFAVALVCAGIFRWVTLSYLITGHTHGPIDGTFGEVAVKLSHSEFDDDATCIELLNGIVRKLGIDATSRYHAKAYKHDECARWDDWWDQLGLSFANLTGPDAPHYFRVCCRADIGANAPLPHDAAQERAHGTGCVGSGWLTPHRDDLVLVVKDRMASLRVAQVVPLVPAALQRRVLRAPMPTGLHDRRPGGEDMKRKCARVATQLAAERVISQVAADYLVQWATGTRPRVPRPGRYSFLLHRWKQQDPGAPRENVRYQGGEGLAPRVRVAIRGVSGAPLPEDEEGAEGEEELALQPAQ